MTEEKKRSASSYILRVVMLEKEVEELDRIRELDGHASRSEVVRRAIEHYGLFVNRNYAKKVAARRSAERASHQASVSPLDEARALIEANRPK